MIGKECDRTEAEQINFRNSDIDYDRTHLNYHLKDAPAHGFYAEWHDVKTNLNAQYRDNKNAVAFQGMVITADKAFFESLGYVPGQPMTPAMEKYFEDSYKWAVAQIGYQGTDRNVLSAVVHLDEKTPHLHIYYLPVTEKWREKVYQKDENGKILRSEKGTPLQAKDEKGKVIYEFKENAEAPRLSKSDFWYMRGGSTSYRQLQDSYQEHVGKAYGLERGEVGSDREHKTKYEWEHEQLRSETKALKAEVEPLREMKTQIDEVAPTERKLPFGYVAVKEKEQRVLTEQAQTYRLNREPLTTAQEMLAKAKNTEARLSDWNQNLARREGMVKIREDRQANINKAYDEAQKEIGSLKAELASEKTSHAAQIGELEAEVSKLKAENKTLSDRLERAQERLYAAVSHIKEQVQHFSMFRYGYGADQEYQTSMTPRQGAMFGEIIKRTKRWLQRNDEPLPEYNPKRTAPELHEATEEQIKGKSEAVLDFENKQEAMRPALQEKLRQEQEQQKEYERLHPRSWGGRDDR